MMRIYQLFLPLRVLIVLLGPWLVGGSAAAEAGYGAERVEAVQEVRDSDGKNDAAADGCPHAFTTPNWEDISFAVHRNGEPEPCAGAVPSSAAALQQALSRMQSQSCHEEALQDKYQLESFLTDFLSSQLDTTSSCGPLKFWQTPRHQKDGEAPRGASQTGTLLEFCDMGPDRTVIQSDHDSLVRVASTGTLPCRWYTREGLRVTSLSQLAELITAATAAAAAPEDDEVCTVVDNGKEVCVGAFAPALHLYAVPAGRMFMFAPKHVGERFVLDHVRDSHNQTVTLEVLSVNPRIFDIHHFFNRDESDQLMQKALGETSETHRFHRSTTGTAGANVIARRTSENAWDTHGATALMIKRRCFELLGIDEYNEAMADGLQILRYNQTTAYTPHFDHLDNPASESYDYDSAGKGGNRFATILLYFTDLQEGEGGETVFPKAWPPEQTEEEHVEHVEGLRRLRESGEANMLAEGSWEETMTVQCRTRLVVRPRAARAVLFYSQYPDGKQDPLSYHGSCPILGNTTKLAANLWTWSGIRPEFAGAPRKFEEQSKESSSAANRQLHATFRNTQTDPAFREAEVYYDEDGFFGKLGFGDPPVAVNTYAGHRWNIKVKGETLKTFIIDPDQPTQVFEV